MYTSTDALLSQQETSKIHHIIPIVAGCPGAWVNTSDLIAFPIWTPPLSYVCGVFGTRPRGLTRRARGLLGVLACAEKSRSEPLTLDRGLLVAGRGHARRGPLGNGLKWTFSRVSLECSTTALGAL